MTPPSSRARVKSLADSAQEVAFHQFALNLLETDASAGKIGAGSFALLEAGVVIQVISDPALSSSGDAVRLAKAAARLDERIDGKILNTLASASRDWPRDVPKDRIARALELIDAISDCRRLVIPLMKFAKLPDPKIRSKAVKLMARASQNSGWVESVLSDPDPRVRCNLMEGFAAQMGVLAQPLLRRATLDPNHRVATTALLALARLGDAGSREKLQHMATDEREHHSRAAAWALKQLEETTPSSTAPHPSA